jgi:feruloyl esterase
MYSGTDDNSVLPRMVTDYYDQVAAVIGGHEKAQQFVRLFELPGVGHCQGGSGADVVDYLSAIEAWVEGSSPPNRLVAYHLRRSNTDTLRPISLPPNIADVSFSRAVFPYPVQARYSGSGDPNNEGSFEAFDANQGSN